MEEIKRGKGQMTYKNKYHLMSGIALIVLAIQNFTFGISLKIVYSVFPTKAMLSYIIPSVIYFMIGILFLLADTEENKSKEGKN